MELSVWQHSTPLAASPAKLQAVQPRADIYPDQPKVLHLARSTPRHKWPLAIIWLKKILNPTYHIDQTTTSSYFFSSTLSTLFRLDVLLFTVKMGFADILTDAGATSMSLAAFSV